MMKFAMTQRYQSLRLAASYLAIIMVLCLGFSVLFYNTSTSGLDLKLTSSPVSSSETPGNNLGLDAKGSGVSSLSLSGDASQHVDQLNAQLEKQLQTIRSDLVYRLALFNLSAFVVGAFLSYYLARRTLRPIEAAMESQRQFASDASHELRTPLTAMQLQIEQGLRKLRLSQPAQMLLESNLEELKHLSQLSDALLQLARGSEHSALQPVWLDEVATQAMNRVVARAQVKKIAIHDKAPHLQVDAHLPSLLEAMVILLDNAITYSPNRSTITIQGAAQGRLVQLEVRDEGPGISPEDMPHLFKRFYRAQSSRHAHPAGHGLGLAIARALVTKQRGEITVANASKKGAVFSIKMPLYRGK